VHPITAFLCQQEVTEYIKTYHEVILAIPSVYDYKTQLMISKSEAQEYYNVREDKNVHTQSVK